MINLYNNQINSSRLHRHHNNDIFNIKTYDGHGLIVMHTNKSYLPLITVNNALYFHHASAC